jgi:hypothetical protein
VGPYYNGPWTVISYNRLPPGLRKHKHGAIIGHRDAEYRRYEENRHNYRGKSYRPEKGKGHGNRGNGKDNGNGHGNGKKRAH